MAQLLHPIHDPRPLEEPIEPRCWYAVLADRGADDTPDYRGRRVCVAATDYILHGSSECVSLPQPRMHRYGNRLQNVAGHSLAPTFHLRECLRFLTGRSAVNHSFHYVQEFVRRVGLQNRRSSSK